MEKIKKFQSIMSAEVAYIAAIIAFVAVLFIIAVVCEKMINKKNGRATIKGTKKITLIGIFGALAAVLMYIEVPLPFAPPFYKLDISEVPVMISGFMMGPVAGVATEFIKIVIKLIIKPTSTVYIGEFANFIVGCTFIIPASIIYMIKKNKNTAVVGMSVGTLVMTVAGCFANAFILLPAYAQFYGGIGVDALVAMGTEVNSAIKDLFTFVVLAVAPVNILKGVVVTVIVTLVYKKISKLIKTRL